jgi:hypothetical protein
MSPPEKVLVEGGKFMGDTRYTVHNIAPDTGKAAVRFEISWSTPIKSNRRLFVH